MLKFVKKNTGNMLRITFIICLANIVRTIALFSVIAIKCSLEVKAEPLVLKNITTRSEM